MAAAQDLQNERTLSRRARLSDVAELAGVSRGAAGHVLNKGRGTSRVAPQTAQRIRDAAKRLNYQPHYAARVLRGKRSRTFGFLVASAGDPLRSFLAEFFDAESVKVGCRVLVANTFSVPEVASQQFNGALSELSRRQVDGVVCAVHHWIPGNRAALLEQHPNTVFYEYQGIPGTAGVAVDREEAVRLAVRHLIQRGRRRIGMALMTLSRPTHQARQLGWQAELAAHGLPADEALLFDGESHGLAFAWHNKVEQKWDFPTDVIDRAIDFLVQDGGADAIVAHDDFWAAELIKRMHLRGIRVPRDVAVVGYLNHYLADWIAPALTTIDLCHKTAARMLVRMLERMVVEGPPPEDQRMVQVKPQLIVRESA